VQNLSPDKTDSKEQTKYKKQKREKEKNKKEQEIIKTDTNTIIF
jgi:uncharacterized membrane protein YcgQ (UPF0703/DUF1980 family)